MFRKSLFRTTRLCVGEECALLLQGQGKHMFIQSNDCTTSESFASRDSHDSHWIGLFKSYQTLLSALISATASIRISSNIWRYSKLQQTAVSQRSAQQQNASLQKVSWKDVNAEEHHHVCLWPSQWRDHYPKPRWDTCLCKGANELEHQDPYCTNRDKEQQLKSIALV